MKLVLNGKQINCSASLTVSELLIEQKVKMPEMVSVELNGQILRRHEFDSTILKEDDQVELLYFMGGGN
jgi:sulfur carrier protein